MTKRWLLCCMKAQLAKVLNIEISTITCKRRVNTHIIAYNVHPRLENPNQVTEMKL